MFQWKEEYSIDGCVIDHEHQHLFELANRVLAFEISERQIDAVKEAIRNAYDFIEFHFSHEEELMREAGYSGYEKHVRKHQVIRNKMDVIPCKCYSIEQFIGEFKRFMTRWITKHIIEEDAKIRPCVKASIAAGEIL